MAKLYTFFLLIFLVGCETTNPYNDYYKSYLGQTPEYGSPNYKENFIFLAEGQEPTLNIKTFDSEEEAKNGVLSYFRNGYILIGASEFTRTHNIVNSNLAVSKAKEVGATHILAFSIVLDEVKYKEKVRLPSYSNTNSNTYANANAYSNNIYNLNSASAYGNSNTYSSTNGYSTALVDATYLKFAQGAGYFVKRNENSIKFGAGIKDVPSEIRATIETNKGVYVEFLINGSPAFKADILEGDIILAANGKDVYDLSFIEENIGKTVLLKIYRKGNYIEKSVQFNP